MTYAVYVPLQTENASALYKALTQVTFRLPIWPFLCNHSPTRHPTSAKAETPSTISNSFRPTSSEYQARM